MGVEWFEAEIDEPTLAALAGYDHYRFSLDGCAAVLITYLAAVNGAASSDVGHRLVAVRHCASSHYPTLPPKLLDIVDQLPWRPSTPPSTDRVRR